MKHFTKNKKVEIIEIFKERVKHKAILSDRLCLVLYVQIFSNELRTLMDYCDEHELSFSIVPANDDIEICIIRQNVEILLH